MRIRYRDLLTRDEVDEIAQYLEARGEGLGDRFLEDLERLYRRLETFPESCRAVLPRIRQGSLRVFPYAVYYTVLEDSIEVLAVVHFKRHENAWRSKL